MKNTSQILIVDDDQRMAKTLKDILTVKGFAADIAHSGTEALEKLEKSAYNCVLTDIKMPGMNGVELFKIIKDKMPDMPVVFMTAYAPGKLVAEGLDMGAIASVSKPLDIDTLLSFFSRLRKEQSIAIVDDDPNFCKTLGDILRNRGFTIIEISDPDKVLNTITPDVQLTILDMKLKETTGLVVLEQIRKKCPDMPVVLVTGYGQEMAEIIKKAIDIDAYTCLYKPLQFDEFFEVITELQHRTLGRILGKPFRKRGLP
jgi:two-component system response regulator HydG